MNDELRTQLGSLLLGALLLGACSNQGPETTEHPTEDPSSREVVTLQDVAGGLDGTRLEAVEGSGSVIVNIPTFCELLSAAAFVGRYEVERIVATLEPNRRGNQTAYTYVVFERIDGWGGGAPAYFRYRMRGGPLPDGTQAGYEHDFAAGEELVLFAGGEIIGSEHEPYNPLGAASIFRKGTNDRFGNAMLFGRDGIAAPELEQRVADAFAGNCVEEEPSNDYPPSPAEPEEGPDSPDAGGAVVESSSSTMRADAGG